MNSMNPMKRLLAKILAAGLIVTSIPVTDIHVYADTIPETLTLSEESSGDNLILPEELSGTKEGQPAGIITEADGQQEEPLTVAPAEDSILSGDALNDASDDVLSGRVSGDYADDMLLSWQGSLNDIDGNTGNDTDPGYVEGDVIVCINESYDGDRKSYAAEGYGTAGTVDRALSLLDGAEELMDVTRAVNESGLASGQTEEAGELKENNPESGPAASKDSALPADDEEYTIKYIHSDIYSTGQMIEMLEAMPEVLFAEPNYIYQLEGEDTAEDELVSEETENGAKEDVLLTGETEETIAADSEEENAGNDDEDGKPTDESTGSDAEEAPAPAETANEGSETELSENTGTRKDNTYLQYAYGDGEGGMDVPDWNDMTKRNVGDNIVVAVLDTGVDYNHEDLKDVMWDDGLRYPELTALGGGKFGYSAPTSSSDGKSYMSYDPMDDNNHGTHCAGSIGAPWNGYGVSGTANGVEIMAVKAGNDKGSLSSSWTMKGFNYIKTAKEAGVNVVAVNNSWGGYARSDTELLAVRELSAMGIVNCFSAGNNSEDIDRMYFTGTLLRENEGTVTVDSNDKKGEKSDFSNYGIRTTDVSAPGTGIMSTYPTGKGIPDPKLCDPVTDIAGKEAREDFNKGNTYFEYASPEEVSFEICEDEGQKVMAVKGISKTDAFMSLKCAALSEVPGYLALSAKYEEKNALAVAVDVLLTNGKYVQCKPSYYEGTEYSSRNVYELPKDINTETPEIRLSAYRISGSGTYYINGLALVKERPDYGYMSGTSMATPAVTGEVAVLASRWPGDSAGKRAARVIGSTKASDKLKGTSRTDGIANVRKALNCEYSPVVNKAYMENGLITVSGYFFGDTKGSVIITDNGTVVDSAEIKEWKGQNGADWDKDGNNTEDIVRIDPGAYKYDGNELKITVTSADNRSGSRILTVSGVSGTEKNKAYYEELSLPLHDAQFMSTYFTSGAALEGAIYYSGQEDVGSGTESVLWKYTLPGEGTGASWEKTSDNVNVFSVSNICAWDRKLVFADGSNGHIKLYSPDEGVVYDTGMVIPAKDKNEKYAGLHFINAANSLFLIMTVSALDDKTKSYVNNRTELYSINAKTETVEKLYTLKSIQPAPVLIASGDGAGGITTIHSLNKSGETDIYEETITVNGDSVSSVLQKIKLPESCFYNGQILTGSGNQYGIVLAGPANRTNGADNFLYSLNDGTLTECTRQMAPGRPAESLVTEYKGRTYFLCLDMYSEDGRTFSYTDDEEFRGSSEKKDPLHYYGDDKAGDDERMARQAILIPTNNGQVSVGKKISVSVAPQTVKKGGGTIPVSYIFYSENAAIAAVDQKGNVTGKSKGTTYIHASGMDADGNIYEGSCEIDVTSKITGIKLSAGKLSVASGSRFRLTAALTSAEVSTSDIEWTVSTPAQYPGAVYKTGEGIGENGNYADFQADSVSGKVKVTITAKVADGSNKKASCVVTLGNPVKGITLKKGTIPVAEGEIIPLNAGKTVKLKAVISPTDAINKTVEWSSSDASVATVDKNGKVKAVGAGKCAITAAAKDGSGASGGCCIEVAAPVKTATLSQTGTITLGEGMEHEICFAKILPVNCSPYEVSWESSDPSVASVTGSTANINGAVITAHKTGKATISAVIGNSVPGGKASITKKLTVKVGPSSEAADSVKILSGNKIISDTAEDNRILIGKALTLKAVVYKDGTALKTGEANVLWSSSDPGIATVNNKGKVTSYREGKVTVTVTVVPKDAGSEPVSASCNLYIYNPVKHMQWNLYNLSTGNIEKADVKSLTAAQGERFILGLNYTVEPKTGLDPVRESKSFEYSISDKNVVTVEKTGGLYLRFIAKGPGKAVITIKAKDGSNKTAKCTVKVLGSVQGLEIAAKNLGSAKAEPVQGISITVTGLAMSKSFKLAPVISPAKAVDKKVVYMSSNTAAVTVSSTGVVKRCGEGAADIYVITADGGCTAVCHVAEN